MKKIINFILIHFSIFFDFVIVIFKLCSCFILSICFSDKDKFFKSIFIKEETIEEYKIWGILYKILYIPLSIYILCIVSSLKKNPLIVMYKENDTKKRDNFKDIKL